MEIHPTEIHGAWRRGWSLDLHTTSSEFIGYDEAGHPQFDTTRSPMGELLYQLKYQGRQNANEVASVMAEFLGRNLGLLSRINLIIPIPPSTQRAIQPVVEIAIALGRHLNKTVAADIVRKTRATPGLKDIHDPEERRELLDGAFEAERLRVNGQGILLVDDLYRSGATANAVTIALMGAGAARVYFLAATRTRRNT